VVAKKKSVKKTAPKPPEEPPARLDESELAKLFFKKTKKRAIVAGNRSKKFQDWLDENGYEV
jgi:hypothetical protein